MNEQTCKKCQTVKGNDRFPSRKGKIEKTCKDCVNAKCREKRAHIAGRAVNPPRDGIINIADGRMVCTDCKEGKCIDEYPQFTKKGEKRYYSFCKDCRSKKMKAYRKDDTIMTHRTQYQREYRQKPEVKERAKNHMANWYKRNKERVQQTHIIWRNDNIEHARASDRARYENNESYRIGRNSMCTIWRAISQNKSTCDIIKGCSWQRFRKWMQWQMNEDDETDMTWLNYGEAWCIDHVIPQAIYDLEDPTEFNECFHWTNIRPFSARKNASKQDTIDANTVHTHNKLITQYCNHLRKKGLQINGKLASKKHMKLQYPYNQLHKLKT